MPCRRKAPKLSSVAPMVETAACCSELSANPRASASAGRAATLAGSSMTLTQPRDSSDLRSARTFAPRTASSSALPGCAARLAVLLRRAPGRADHPASACRARLRAQSQRLRQRCREHLADGVVVILRRPFEKCEHCGVEHGLGVEYFKDRLHPLRRNLGGCSLLGHDTDQPLPAERYAHAYSRSDGLAGILLGG